MIRVVKNILSLTLASYKGAWSNSTVHDRSYTVLISRSAMEIVDALDRQSERGSYTAKSVLELKAAYPDLEEMEHVDANHLLDELAMTEPLEVPESEWHMAMPLSKAGSLCFSSNGQDASFKSAAYVRGSIVECYLRLDGGYYRLRERDSVPHATLVKKVIQYLSDLDMLKQISRAVPGL